MQCPSCGKGLVMSVRQNIEIDYCPGCRGVWLDRGELDKIIERSAARPQGGPTAQSPWDDDRHDFPHPGRRRKRRRSFLEELFD